MTRDFAAERRDIAFLNRVLPYKRPGEKLHDCVRVVLMRAAMLHCNGNSVAAGKLMGLSRKSVRLIVKGPVSRATVMSPEFQEQIESIALLVDFLSDLPPGENAFQFLRRRIVRGALFRENFHQQDAADLVGIKKGDMHYYLNDLQLRAKDRRAA